MENTILQLGNGTKAGGSAVNVTKPLINYFKWDGEGNVWLERDDIIKIQIFQPNGFYIKRVDSVENYVDSNGINGIIMNMLISKTNFKAFECNTYVIIRNDGMVDKIGPFIPKDLFYVYNPARTNGKINIFD